MRKEYKQFARNFIKLYKKKGISLDLKEVVSNIRSLKDDFVIREISTTKLVISFITNKRRTGFFSSLDTGVSYFNNSTIVIILDLSILDTFLRTRRGLYRILRFQSSKGIRYARGDGICLGQGMRSFSNSIHYGDIQSALLITKSILNNK